MTALDEQADWGQQPPQNLDAEMSVLGAMLLSKDAIADVVEVLQPADFYRPAHQTVYDAILRLYVDGNPADPVTVCAEIGKDINRVGGAPYLLTLCQHVPAAASASYYAGMVAEMAQLRRIVEAGTRITQYGYAGVDGDVAEIRDLVQREIYQATSRSHATDVVPINVGLTGAWDELEAIHDGGGVGGVPTGLNELDDILHGLHPGEMVIVAGRPGSGKSVLALNMLRAATIMHDMPAVLFSLEMSRNEGFMRLLSAETRIDLNAMRKGRLKDAEWAAIASRISEIDQKPLFVDDSAHLTLMEIRAKSRRLKQQHGLRLIVVDYLQLVLSGKRHENRQAEVQELSRQFKLLAKELEVPVVVLAQLNRNPETRADKKPQVSDLRESGGLEADADVVILVHRPDLGQADDPRAGEADLIVGKHRNGPTGTATVAAQLHYSRFTDLARADRWEGARNFGGV